MDFNSKLQQLRTNSDLTQEQLAEKICVSRVTVSKWESGRGYPNIESLKLIAQVFSVSIDELLSGDELLDIAENERREGSRNLLSLFFGVVDLMSVLLLVLPFFGNDHGSYVAHVNLLTFEAPLFILAISYTLVFSSIIFGVVELALQNLKAPLWLRLKNIMSVCLTLLEINFFIMTRQPYATSFILSLLLFKGILLIKKE